MCWKPDCFIRNERLAALDRPLRLERRLNIHEALQECVAATHLHGLCGWVLAVFNVWAQTLYHDAEHQPRVPAIGTSPAIKRVPCRKDLLSLNHLPILCGGTADRRQHERNVTKVGRIQHDGIRQEAVVEVELARLAAGGAAPLLATEARSVSRRHGHLQFMVRAAGHTDDIERHAPRPKCRVLDEPVAPADAQESPPVHPQGPWR